MTPWQKIFAHFDMTQAQFARASGFDKSKVSRALSDDAGLINGADQVALMKLAKQHRIAIPAEDFLPKL